MSVNRGNRPRSKMTPRERHLRSQLNQLISSKALVHGTLLYRERSCGRSTCKCTQGEKHPALYLVVREERRQRQVFIPKFMEEEVRLWVAHYQKMKQLGEDLSRICLKRIEKREI